MASKHHDYVTVFTPQFELDPARTCLVVVDMQYATGHPETGLGKLLESQGKLADASYRFTRIAETVVPNTKRLLDYAREHDIRRVFLTYGSEVSDYSDLSKQMRTLCESTNNRVGEREHDIIDELKPEANERVFNKISPSAFNSTPIELVLHTYGVDTLVFVGVSTNMCVEHTMRDASDRGFLCLIVDDACGADSEEMHDAALKVLQRLYGTVATTDEVIATLDAKLTAGIAA